MTVANFFLACILAANSFLLPSFSKNNDTLTVREGFPHEDTEDDNNSGSRRGSGTRFHLILGIV